MSEIHVVVGGAYGSEGKGNVTGWLSRTRGINHVVRVAGPNAGHSAYDAQGRKWALRQVPIAAVTNPDCELYIAAGSEIDFDVLEDEIKRLDNAGFHILGRLHVDASATLITEQHRMDERSADLTGRVGSTGKGIGAARADRIMRTADTWLDLYESDEAPEWVGAVLCYDVARRLTELLRHHANEQVLIEGTQGYGLGLHTPWYPQTTSSDARAIDFLAMAGLSPWMDGVETTVWVVYRTYPIRVAGNSGPMYRETDWATLAERSGGHIEPEHTTVTGKVRRVGEWDDALAINALVANGGPSENVKPVLLFLDYIFPEINDLPGPGDWGVDIWNFLNTKSDLLRSKIAAVGTGPDQIWSL